MADSRRADRVAEAIREDIATFLVQRGGGGVRDPRVKGLVTVTGVEVVRDLRHAKVFVSVLGTEAERKSTMVGLASLAGHLRARLARSLKLRIAPEIVFVLDPSVERAARIDSLLEQIRTERPKGDDGDPK